MRSRYRTWLWLVLLGLTPQTGCVVFNNATVPNQPGQQSTQTPAITSLPLAAFHDDEEEQLHLKTAATFEKNGCLGEAAAQLELAREANPKLNVSHRLARLYEELDQYPQALAEYNKELAAEQQSDADLLNGVLAGLKKLLGRPLPKSNEPALLNDIGYCLFLKRDWAESESYLRRSLEKDPQNLTAWVNLGLTLAAENRLEESLDASEHAVKPSQAYSNIAYVQATRLDRLAEARESYKKALELDPENKAARGALTELHLIEKKEATRADAPPVPGQPG